MKTYMVTVTRATATTVPGAPDQPHGNGQRDDHDQPLVDRAGRRRRLRHHRLQDRGFAQWHLELDQPRRRHRHHHHHLRHTGLSAGTTRHYRVSAINATGTGAASSTDNATTGTTTDTGPLTLTVEAVEDTVTEGEPGALPDPYVQAHARGGGAVVVPLQGQLRAQSQFGRDLGDQFAWWPAVLGGQLRHAGRRGGRAQRQVHGHDREAGQHLDRWCGPLQPRRGVHGGLAVVGDGDDFG